MPKRGELTRRMKTILKGIGKEEITTNDITKIVANAEPAYDPKKKKRQVITTLSVLQKRKLIKKIRIGLYKKTRKGAAVTEMLTKE